MDLNIKNLKYIHLHQLLLKLRPLEAYYNCNNNEDELKLQDIQKLCETLLKVLQRDLSLEEISSLYSAVVILFLLGDAAILSLRLELLNECFNYSDTLKPTMIDYATRDLLENFKFVASIVEGHKDYDYIKYLIKAIPHIISASETGKMISLGLLRAFIVELASPSTESPIIMHIYRNISEIWQSIKTINMEALLNEWEPQKIYIFLKSFSLMLATALNTNNTALKQAGYRGFELPQADTGIEISGWFKTLKTKLAEKYIGEKSKSGQMLVRFIDFNILSFLPEAGN